MTYRVGDKVIYKLPYDLLIEEKYIKGTIIKNFGYSYFVKFPDSGETKWVFAYELIPHTEIFELLYLWGLRI